MDPLVLLILVSVLFLAGLAGTIVPGLPGIPLIFLGALLYGYFTEFATISPITVGVFGFAALIALGADYLGSVLGARYGGGSWWAIGGVLIGALIGVAVLGPLGLILGALAGGFGGALVEGQTNAGALRVTLTTFVGIIGASIFQFVLGLSLLVTFVVALIV
jgi:hypothetical protein